MATPTVKHFNVWITACKPKFLNELIVKMVKRGFTVGPLGRTLTTAKEESDTAIISLYIYRTPKDDEEEKLNTPTGIYDEVCNVLKVVDARFISIVVSEHAHCTWNHGSATLEDEVYEAKKAVN